PDRYAMLDLVDDEAAGIEGLASMCRAPADPDCHVGKRKAPDARDAEGVSHGKARGRFADDALPLLDCEGLERLVLERSHLASLVEIAHPSLERDESPRAGVEQLR